MEGKSIKISVLTLCIALGVVILIAFGCYSLGNDHGSEVYKLKYQQKEMQYTEAQAVLLELTLERRDFMINAAIEITRADSSRDVALSKGKNQIKTQIYYENIIDSLGHFDGNDIDSFWANRSRQKN